MYFQKPKKQPEQVEGPLWTFTMPDFRFRASFLKNHVINFFLTSLSATFKLKQQQKWLQNHFEKSFFSIFSKSILNDSSGSGTVPEVLNRWIHLKATFGKTMPTMLYSAQNEDPLFCTYAQKQYFPTFTFFKTFTLGAPLKSTLGFSCFLTSKRYLFAFK